MYFFFNIDYLSRYEDCVVKSNIEGIWMIYQFIFYLFYHILNKVNDEAITI